MTIDEIKILWEADFPIDDSALDIESLSIHKLHSKYSTFYANERIRRIDQSNKLDDLVAKKSLYYMGKLSEEELKNLNWEPFGHRVLKTELKNYLETDGDIVLLKRKLEYRDIVIEYLKGIVDQINKRSFYISNALGFKRFMNGLS